MGLISLEQAKADGWTPSGLRGLANSLERISRRGYQDWYVNDDGTGYVHSEGPYDWRQASRSARYLRGLAGRLQRGE